MDWVSGIGAVQPLLVLLYSLVLSAVRPHAFGEWMPREHLRPQLVGMLMLPCGVVAISLR